MSNYPDNMNWARYDATIGSVGTTAERVWEIEAEQLNDIAKRAYHEFPLNSTQRRQMIGDAMDKAQSRITCHVSLSSKEKVGLLRCYYGVMAADSADQSPQSVSEQIGDWMHIFYLAIERQQREGVL